MNRKSTGILFLIVCAIMLASCSMDHRAQTSSGLVTGPDQTTEWTILYYGAGNYDGDLLPSGVSQTVAAARGLQDVFLTDRVHAVALMSTESDQGRCRFYDIQFRPGDAGNEINSSAQDWGVRDMSSPDLLRQFVDSAIALYPAEHYALIIGGAGEAWRGVCRDQTGGRVMPIPALNQSLDNTTSHHGAPAHFDLLLWLTPGMSALEVAYEMRANADYMVATSSVLPQPGFLATNRWVLDLAADPDMDAERLGRFVVSRMAAQAETEDDSLATFVLFNLRGMETLAREVSGMGNAVRSVLTSRAAQLLQVCQSLQDAPVCDSSAIDLAAFTAAVLAHPALSTEPELRAAAERAQSAFNEVLADRRTTRVGGSSRGITVYSPIAASNQNLTGYSELQMSREQPGWAGLLSAMQESGPALVNVSGDIRWTGHALDNLYMFLNTAQVGAPVISLTSPVSITNSITPDFVEFAGSFALDGDSVSAYVGFFQDLDSDQQLSTGDRYGYFHLNANPPRDWIGIHNGESLGGLHIELTRTF